jgi:serine/threonine protein kinase
MSTISFRFLKYTWFLIRWWRLSDVYVNQKKYRDKLDTWSVGCIMAELILLQPTFRGSDHIDPLNKIFDIIGTPDLTTLDGICTPGL